MANVKLSDVAREAGVHVGTVSRALNPATRSRVNAATAARIIQVAERLGYETHITARALRTQRTQTVGVLIPDLTNPLFPPIVRGIEDTLGKARYTALLTNTDNDVEREHWMIATLRNRQVDGFLVASGLLDDPTLMEMARKGTPMVAINRTTKDELIASVLVDDELGVSHVVAHLAALGHERIAHVAGPAGTSTGRSRMEAFMASLGRHGLRQPPELVVQADSYSIAAGTKCTRELLKRGESFTAVVAANDLLALGVLDVLRENRITCPDRVSVTGFNDLAMVERMSPALTTVRVPKHDMGAQAARLLLGLIDDTDTRRSVVLPVVLVIRESTAPPPPRGTGLFGW